MVSVTLSLSEDVKRKMEEHEEINWSGLVRTMIIEKIKELEWKEKMKEVLLKEAEVTNWAVEKQKEWRKSRWNEINS